MPAEKKTSKKVFNMVNTKEVVYPFKRREDKIKKSTKTDIKTDVITDNKAVESENAALKNKGKMQVKKKQPKPQQPAKPLQPKAKQNKKPVKKSNATLKIIPLGGLNEVGKNITAYECENDIFIVDCGLAFPDESMLGVDLVIPDFSYL